MRPHTFEMPLQVLLTLFDQPEETVELPDDATVLTMMEWVSEKYGIDVSKREQFKVISMKGGKVLKNDDLLSSDPRFLKLRIVQVICGG
jgi:hypothetical protein